MRRPGKNRGLSPIVPYCSDPHDLAIVKAVLAMAHSLNINVIAESVETDSQLQVLRALGCNEYQGFLFCAALPSAELERRFFHR